MLLAGKMSATCRFDVIVYRQHVCGSRFSACVLMQLFVTWGDLCVCFFSLRLPEDEVFGLCVDVVCNSEVNRSIHVRLSNTCAFV